MAAALAATGCGGGERQDASDGGGTYLIGLERTQFPANQRIGRRSTFVITVRNAGEKTIPNLAVTLHGFSGRASDPRDADGRVSLWIVDDSPAGQNMAIEDTWTAGPLQPGRRATLRWRVTPVVAGSHALSYSIAPNLQGSGRARLSGGGAARGTLRVKVDAQPAPARVDPLSGRVIREE